MEAFIRNVTEQIRCVRARAGVARELTDHIEDQAAAYEEAGDTHAEAVKKAVQEMGDPVAVGVEMDRIHRPQADFKLIVMAFVFSVVGFFLIFEIDGLAQHPEYIWRHCVNLLLSFGVMTGMYFLDYSFIGRYAYGVCVVMTIVLGICRAVVWMSGEPYYTYMPVYLYLPVYAAMLYRLRGGGYGAVAWGIGLLLGVMLPVQLMAGWSTMAAVGMIGMILLLTAVWKGWFVVDRKLVTATIIAGFVLLPAIWVIMRIVLGEGVNSFRWMRLQAFLHPEQYAGEAGYLYLWLRQKWDSVQLIGAADNMFAEGDLIGSFHSGSNYVILVLVCKYGMIAGIAVVLAFAAVIVRAFRIVRRQKNQMGFMMAAACFMIFLINCLEGILLNTGYWPTIGNVQFPFISYGLPTAVTYGTLIGLLLSLYRNEKIIIDEKVIRRPAWRLSVRLEKR